MTSYSGDIILPIHCSYPQSFEVIGQPGFQNEKENQVKGMCVGKRGFSLPKASHKVDLTLQNSIKLKIENKKEKSKFWHWQPIICQKCSCHFSAPGVLSQAKLWHLVSSSFTPCLRGFDFPVPYPPQVNKQMRKLQDVPPGGSSCSPWHSSVWNKQLNICHSKYLRLQERSCELSWQRVSSGLSLIPISAISCIFLTQVGQSGELG